MTGKEMALSAKAKTKLYSQEYPYLIKKSIDGSKIYRNGTEFRELEKTIKKVDENKISFNLINATTVSALKNIFSDPFYANKKIAVLNFAAYKNAGGIFLKGGKSQEASLCHASYLYNVLSAFNKEYYVINQRKLYKSLYTDAALYTPNINFFLLEDNQDFLRTSVDVISCSPPNIAAYCERPDYHWDGRDIEKDILDSRLSFIKSVCELNNIEVLIAGAWGCGSFDCSGWSVATTFNRIFRYSSTLENIIFAIPSKNEFHCSRYYSIFERTIEIGSMEKN